MRADPGGRSLRLAALTSGTLGLLAIGALALMVTPDRANTPSAVQTPASFVDVAQLSVTTPVTGPIQWVPVTTSVAAFAVGELANALGGTRGDADATTVSTTMTSPATSTTVVVTAVVAPGVPSSAAAPADVPRPTPTGVALGTPLATLLGDGLAVVTAKAIGGVQEGDTVTVQLASGRVVDATVVDTAERAALVQLPTGVDGERVVELADRAPDPDAVVTLLLDTPIKVPMSALADVGAPEGTAVVDTEGRLVGLCTLGDDGSTQLAPVDADSVDDDAADAAPGTPPVGSESATTTVTTTVAPAGAPVVTTAGAATTTTLVDATRPAP